MTLSEIFRGFHDSARIWTYAFPTKLTEAQLAIVRDALSDFVTEWHSHQVRVKGAFEIVYDQFVFLSAEAEDGVSGCSIDSSVRVFKLLKDEISLDALDRSLVFYREGDVIKSAPRSEFQKLVESGSVESQSIVFNNTILTIGELRGGRWELPFAASWHADAFSVS